MSFRPFAAMDFITCPRDTTTTVYRAFNYLLPLSVVVDVSVCMMMFSFQ